MPKLGREQERWISAFDVLWIKTVHQIKNEMNTENEIKKLQNRITILETDFSKMSGYLEKIEKELENMKISNQKNEAT